MPSELFILASFDMCGDAHPSSEQMFCLCTVPASPPGLAGVGLWHKVAFNFLSLVLWFLSKQKWSEGKDIAFLTSKFSLTLIGGRWPEYSFENLRFNFLIFFYFLTLGRFLHCWSCDSSEKILNMQPYHGSSA